MLYIHWPLTWSKWRTINTRCVYVCIYACSSRSSSVDLLEIFANHVCSDVDPTYTNRFCICYELLFLTNRTEQWLYLMVEEEFKSFGLNPFWTTLKIQTDNLITTQLVLQDFLKFWCIRFRNSICLLNTDIFYESIWKKRWLSLLLSLYS